MTITYQHISKGLTSRNCDKGGMIVVTIGNAGDLKWPGLFVF